MGHKHPLAKGLFCINGVVLQMSSHSSDEETMTPMNRISTINYLQDPAVLEYLQVADTHCWRFGVPRPNLAFHPTARCALKTAPAADVLT